MTAHRRENVEVIQNLKNIFDLCDMYDEKIIFAASYRTQKILKNLK